MRKLLLVFLIMITGAVLSLAFPRASIWPIAWVGLVPLLILTRDSRPRTAALAGLAFGIGFFGILLYWTSVFGYLPWILLAVIQSLWIALFAALASMVYRSRHQWLVLLTIPALWTAIEWLRSLGSLSFPWGYLSCSQTHNLPAVQIASFTGVWGLSFVIALFNAALASRREMVLKSVGVAVIVAAVVHISGYWSMNQKAPQREKHPVAVVQASLHADPSHTQDQRINETVHVYTQLTGEASLYQPHLVVWPESAVPGDIFSNQKAHEWVTSVAKSTNAHLLTGGPHFVRETGSQQVTIMNGAHMLSPDGDILDSYYKVHLAPFGEFVPGRNWLPFIERYCPQNIDLKPGEGFNLLDAGFGKTGVMICFESAFPSIARRETIDGADLLCVITKETLFKKTALAIQHHDCAVFRAVENRRFVVRAAASGISSVIDPYGRILDSLGMWERGVLFGEVETRDGLTIYARFGDWFAYLCVAAACCGVVSGIKAQRKKKQSEVKS